MEGEKISFWNYLGLTPYQVRRIRFPFYSSFKSPAESCMKLALRLPCDFQKPPLGDSVPNSLPPPKPMSIFSTMEFKKPNVSELTLLQWFFIRDFKKQFVEVQICLVLQWEQNRHGHSQFFVEYHTFWLQFKWHNILSLPYFSIFMNSISLILQSPTEPFSGRQGTKDSSANKSSDLLVAISY